MKFGKELKVKSVAEWRDKYMSYKKLKRVIGKLAVQIKQQQQRDDQQSLDSQAQHIEQQHGDADIDLTSPLSPSTTAATQPLTARLSSEATPLIHRRESSTSSLVKRRLSQAYGTAEEEDGEAGATAAAGGGGRSVDGAGAA